MWRLIMVIVLLLSACVKQLSAPPEHTVNPVPSVELEPQHTSLQNPRLVVLISEQKLELWDGAHWVKTYPISTSRFGTGNAMGSQKTPLGQHRIFQKIGESEPVGRVFWRRDTLPIIILPSKRADALSDRYITTRILWLEGLELGKNKGGNVDTLHRSIYIHGTNLEYEIGRPASRGCVFMKNNEIIELFDLVKEGTPVEIRM